MTGLSANSGFWCNYYACRENNIVETINYMLSLHKDDFPQTACVGFTITRGDGMVKIWPKVIRKDKTVHDFYNGG